MIVVRFYTTEGCHLCEQAWALIAPIAEQLGRTVQIIDLMDDASAEALYATEIPVLSREDQDPVLRWPFTAQQISEYLQ